MPADLELVRELHAAGRSREALDTCRAFLARAPTRADLLAVAGTLALKLGDLTAAETDLNASLRLDPNNAEAGFNWANSLVRLNRRGEAIVALEKLTRIATDFVPAFNNLGKALYEEKEFARAADAFRAAIDRAPGLAHLHRNLGTAYHEQGNHAGAVACFKRAVSLRPDWPRALQSLANAAMEAGEWQTASSTCLAWLEQRPANVEALGLRAIALDELGETRLADELLNYERLIARKFITEPPDSFASVMEFNASLAQETLTHPTLHVPPADDPRYHCPTLRMTAEFCGDGLGGARAALGALVDAGVHEYVANLARTLPGHPFLQRGPTRFTLTSWSTVLDREGNLDPHVHYDSYVSAVYYPKIPASLSAGEEGAGCILFGGGPARFPARAKRPLLNLRPVEGALLIFPSYFYHRTAPFRATESRMAIAFDTRPFAQ